MICHLHITNYLYVLSIYFIGLYGFVHVLIIRVDFQQLIKKIVLLVVRMYVIPDLSWSKKPLLKKVFLCCASCFVSTLLFIHARLY